MTPQEIIETRMLELWDERNVARLARESKVPRESLAKILGYKRGLGRDVAAKVALALDIDVQDLLPPEAEAVTLGSLDRRLQALQGDVSRAVTLMEQALRLLRASREQGTQGDQAQRRAG